MSPPMLKFYLLLDAHSLLSDSLYAKVGCLSGVDASQRLLELSERRFV